MEAMPVSPLLDAYDAVLLDLDGCVRVGREPTARAVDAVGALRAAGKRVAFVTNDPAFSGEEVVRELWRMGFMASLEEVVTVGGAIQHVLAEQHAWQTAFVIGSDALFTHVQDAGLRILNNSDLARRVDVVVVGGHSRFDFAELRTATQAVLGGAGMLAAGRDRTFPMPDGRWPATGAIVAALEYATAAEAMSVGKPEPQMFLTALDRLAEAGVDPERVLVVGDRLDADVAGAHAAGLDAALVLSGVSSPAEGEAALHGEPPVVAVAGTLAELVLGGVRAVV
jgi:glycerol 3-phosphatase-2